MTWTTYPDKVPNKYYTQKGKDGIYNKPTWYKYGQYKPWMVKDNWKPLKKNWRKTWTTMKSMSEMGNDIWRVVNLMTFWTKEITSSKNILNGVESWKALTLEQACNELNTSPTSLYYHMNKHPALKEQYNEMKSNRREYMREVSETNIQKAISGKMKKLSDKDVVDYSFRMLERTDTNYNPKTIVEATVEEINPERSTQDIIADISDLLKI